MDGWPIYVISLRDEFWTRLEGQARSMGLVATRWPATNGATIDLGAWQDKGLFEPSQDAAQRPMTRGEIGCSHSHLRTWAQIVKQGLPGALILEDDADLPADLPQWLDRAQHHAGEWDVLYLGFTPWAQTVPAPNAPGFVVPDLAPAWNVMHAYLVTAAGVLTMLEQSLPIRMPIDLYVSKQAQSRVRAWQTEKPVVGLCEGTYSSTQGIV